MTKDIPDRWLGRALTAVELQAALDHITAATTPDDVIIAAERGALDPLLDDEALVALAPDEETAPRRYAIPTSQWQLIMDAAHQRMMQWGNNPDISVALMAALPSEYVDPTIEVPDLAKRDFRPLVHELHVTRAACDVIGACSAHLRALGSAYGVGRAAHRTATETWTLRLARLFSMELGSHTQIDADGFLSLIVTTGGGTVYRLAFTPMPRFCTGSGCDAVISDDGTTNPVTEVGMAMDHEHTPIYPLDAPKPGVWEFIL